MVIKTMISRIFAYFNVISTKNTSYDIEIINNGFLFTIFVITTINTSCFQLNDFKKFTYGYVYKLPIIT